jgi:hypothetical protein
MAVFAISDIITWAKISQYLGRFYNSGQRLLQGRDLDPYYPLIIRMQRRELEFMNTFNPSQESIDATANYVYSMTKYIAEAKVIAGQGGSGGIVNPSTGIASTIQDISLEFELGVTASPVTVNGVSVTLPSNGDDSFILPLENIMGGSLLLTVGGTPQPTIATTNSTYTTMSYTASQATITLGPSGTTFQNGNTYLLSGLQFVNS